MAHKCCYSCKRAGLSTVGGQQWGKHAVTLQRHPSKQVAPALLQIQPLVHAVLAIMLCLQPRAATSACKPRLLFILVYQQHELQVGYRVMSQRVTSAKFLNRFEMVSQTRRHNSTVNFEHQTFIGFWPTNRALLSHSGWTFIKNILHDGCLDAVYAVVMVSIPAMT